MAVEEIGSTLNLGHGVREARGAGLGVAFGRPQSRNGIDSRIIPVGTPVTR